MLAKGATSVAATILPFKRAGVVNNSELRTIMIASKESFEPQSSDPLPNSTKVYVPGRIHSEVRVPLREIKLNDTKSFNGQVENNTPVRVYDCSGPWGDENFKGDVTQGLPALREEWIRARGDTAEYEGREVKPMDNGYLSGKHEEYASQAERNRLVQFPGLKRKPLKASKGHSVSQLWYARQGIVTPEMEFIAIRENQKIAESFRTGTMQIADLGKDIKRNDLNKQHAGGAQGTNTYTPS